MGQRCTLRKFKLGRAVDRLEGRGDTQTNFNRLYKCAIRNLMKTSTKINGLNRESKKPRHQYVLGTDQLQHSFTEEDLRFLVDNTLNMNQERALGNLGCSSKGVTSKLRQVFPFCSAHPFWGAVQSFELPSTRKTLVGWSPSIREPPGWSEGQHHGGR